MPEQKPNQSGNRAFMGGQREGDRLGAEGAAQAARGTLAGMESRKTSGNAPAPSGRSKMRPLIVARRWAVAVAWGVAVVALWPAIPRMFAAFLLAFLLVNALWQHAELKRACAMAFALTGLLAIVGEVALGTADYVSVPVLWLVDALGAVIGVLVAYTALPPIDRAINRLG